MKNALVFILFCLPFLSVGQKLKKFTEDPTVYPKELNDYLSNTDINKERLELLMVEFNDLWSYGGISEDESQAIYDISNNFLKKRISQAQDWTNFLSLIGHIETSEEESLLLLWLNDLKDFSRRNPAGYTSKYLATTYSVIFDDVLFDDGRYKWKIYSSGFEFKFDQEPYFEFKELDLSGFYKNDSTIVEATNGVYYPHQFLFKGQGGTSYFTRAGLSYDSAYVVLSDYEVNVTKSSFNADSVLLHTLIYIKEPLMGSFEEKLTSQSGNSSSFPRFTSYRTDFVIEDVVPGADFSGGFSIIGSKFYGTGSPDGRIKASFLFEYEGKRIVRASADRFLMRVDKIYSEDVQAAIYIEEDSIYHPKVTLRYLPESQSLSIIRKKEGLGLAPFQDTYHNLDITFEVLNWDMNAPLMTIGNMNLGSESPVFFESKNYYRGQRFSELQGLDTRNPLFKMKEMSDVYGKRQFTDKEVASFLRMDIRNAHIFMMEMSVKGFVDYNLDLRESYIKDKVFDYVNNFEDKRDYDVIQFVSNLSKGSNARLSLLNYDLEIDGVEVVAVSDSQKVGLYPNDRRLTVHKDMNFDFNGKITAGRFAYWGDKFEFNYDQFRINMNNVDSMRFQVESFDRNEYGQRKLVDVKTVLQGLTGELLIDDPNNKSGRKRYTEYPIFKSAKDSYIYYDKPSIFSGVYEKNIFYVQLEPFEIDSLDNITTRGLKFDGTFTSAGIFPQMNQEIRVQPDYSLGFTTQTPAEGLAAYGKGTFSNTLSLSNKGLRGDGVINDLNSIASSQEFFFFPDSTNGIADTFDISETYTASQSPHVFGEDVFVHWEPKIDVMYTSSGKTPFAMYDDIGMKATGTVAHRPNALSGNGLLEFLDAETESGNYMFRTRKFSAVQMAFRVRPGPFAEWGFALDKARGEIDFDLQKGEFFIQDPANYFSFPTNQYICFMDYAKWDIPMKTISVRKESPQSSSEMISVHSRQDSLRFVAGTTEFSLVNSFLQSFAVPEIEVGDAIIFPDTGYVAIDSGAVMRTLTNAMITANQYSQFHDFYGATVNIDSRNYYSGSADYEYVDQDGTPWPIRFNRIKVDTSGTTVGNTEIDIDEVFFMSPYFAYYGRVGLKADRKALAFDGYTHIESSCPTVNSDWFAFSSIVDPNNIVISLPDIDPDDPTKTLSNGVFLDTDTNSGYAAFLAKNLPVADKQMFFATGKLFYDEKISSYVIIDNERYEDPDAPGNYLAFDNINCVMTGNGEMSIGDNRSQMKVITYGLIKYDLNTDEMALDLVMGLEFFFNSDLQKIISESILSASSLNSTDLERPAFKVAINELLTAKERDKLNTAIESFGAPDKLPEPFEQTIMFSDIQVDWTPEATSFSAIDNIGLSNLGKYFVNRKMKGYVEIQRGRRGDEIYIYLEVNPSVFYYFEYKRNQMSVYSSDDALMTKIKELDIKDRRNEVKGKPPFTYTIGTKGKMSRFLSRYED